MRSYINGLIIGLLIGGAGGYYLGYVTLSGGEFIEIPGIEATQQTDTSS